MTPLDKKTEPFHYSRRDILRTGVLSAGGLLVGGCASGAALTTRLDTPTPSPARGGITSLPEIDALRVTVLVDCYAEDGLSKKSNGCKIARPPKPRSTRNASGRHLLSEYGLSLLLESEYRNKTHTVLYDFGLSDQAVLANLDLLEVDVGAVDTLVLSHGHADHYGGLEGFLRRHGEALRPGTRLLVGHGKAFARRWKKSGNRCKSQGQLHRDRVEKLGMQIEECGDARLLGGQGMVTGIIPMEFAHERPSRSSELHYAGHDMADRFEEELGLVYNVAGKGLVVLTACGHRGVINTVTHAVKVAGTKRVHAVLGGLHLGKHSDEAFAAAAQALENFGPRVVVPMHCTTSKAARKLASRFGDRVVFNSTGSRFEFA